MMLANILGCGSIIIDQKQTQYLAQGKTIYKRINIKRENLPHQTRARAYVWALGSLKRQCCRYTRNSYAVTCIACLWSCRLWRGRRPSLNWEKTFREPLATIWKSNCNESSSIKLWAAEGWLANAFIICTTLPSTCIHIHLSSEE